MFNEISAAVFSKHQLQNLQPCHSISLCTITWLTENEQKCQMKLTGSHNYDTTSPSMSWGSYCCCSFFTLAVNSICLTYSPVFRELVNAHVGMKSYVIYVPRVSNVGENDSLSLPNKPAVAHRPISRI